MDNLSSEIQALRKENNEIKNLVTKLIELVTKNKVDNIWVSERDAASMLEISERSLRRKVKEAAFPFNEINYRHTNGRNFQYSRKGLFKYKQLTSTEQ